MHYGRHTIYYIYPLDQIFCLYSLNFLRPLLTSLMYTRVYTYIYSIHKCILYDMHIYILIIYTYTYTHIHTGLKRDDVRRGQVLAAPNTVKTYKKFKAEVYVLKQAEGGRHTPFFNKYRLVYTYYISMQYVFGVCKVYT